MYLVYRDGTNGMEARIRAAVASFYGVRGRLPALVVVNGTELETAVAAIEALELDVPVRIGGGCLVPEVWLAVSKDRKQVGR